MKKKLALLVAFCLVAVSLFVGCGSDEEEVVSEEAASSSVTEEDVSDIYESSEESYSDSSESAGIEGTFALTGMLDSEGTEYTLAEYAEANGVTEDDLSSSYVFNGDGTGTMNTLGTETEFTYVEDGTTITVTVNGQSFSYEYDEAAGTITSVGSTTGYDSIMTRQ